MRIVFSTRLSDSCTFLFNYDLYDHIILTTVHSPAVRLIDFFVSKLKPTLHHHHEVTNVPKVAAEDTTLTVSNADGGKTTFPVVAGTEINLHVPGLHYNRTLSYFILVTGSETGSDGDW
jgi:hypothetical protein